MLNKFQRPRDYLSIALIVLCTWLPAAMLRSTGWATGLMQVEILAVAAAVTGLTLGRTRLSPGVANLLFAIISVVVPVSLFTFMTITTGAPLDRYGLFITRIYQTAQELIVGRVVKDSILFTLFCGYFFWMIGYFTGYGYALRSNPWQGLLAAAVIFGVISFYYGPTRQTGWWGAVLVFSLMVLAARLYWVERQLDWAQDRLSVDPHAGRAVFVAAGTVSLVLILLCWNLQSIILSLTPGTPENQQFSQFMKDIQSGLQTNIPSLQSSTSLTGSYPASLKLGTHVPIQQTPAFQVKVISTTKPVGRYYWRVRVYDQYVNGQWRAPETVSANGPLLQPAELTVLPALSNVKIQYIWQQGDGSVIPVAGRVSRVDIPSRFEIFPGNGLVSGDGIFIPQQTLVRDSLLMVDSAVFAGSGEDLRGVPYTIPTDVAARSLAIPSTVPRRVIDLGKQLATGGTVFDRVEAVTAYLRKGYEYKSQITPVPYGHDPVDWFLFDSKQGFCNYYASSEVILLRAAGIPARLAVGYSQGEAMADGYQIRMNYGHAWPEVYFPGYGWIPFEPTAAEPDTPYSPLNESGPVPTPEAVPPTNGQQVIQEAQAATPDAQGEGNRVEPSIPRWILSVLLILAAILCMVGLWLIARNKGWIKLPRFSRLIMGWLSALHWRIPHWLAGWDWYSGLPEPGRRYVQLETVSRFFRLSASNPGTPYELLDTLAMILPESSGDLETYKEGLYRSLYSLEKDYSTEECKAAGAALQNALWKACWNRLVSRPKV